MTPYDPAQPVSPLGGEPGCDAAAAPLSRRSGSQRRQCTKSLQIMLTPEQHAVVEGWASAAGLSASAYGKAVLFGTPGPRAKRTPPLHARLFSDGMVTLNRIGNLLNQVAHRLNAGGAITLGAETSATLDEIRQTARVIREAVGRKDRDDNQGQPAQ